MEGRISRWLGVVAVLAVNRSDNEEEPSRSRNTLQAAVVDDEGDEDLEDHGK